MFQKKPSSSARNSSDEKKKIFVDAFMDSFFSHPDIGQVAEKLTNPFVLAELMHKISPPTAPATLSQEVIAAVSCYQTIEEQQCIKAWLKNHHIDEVDEKGQSLLHHAVKNGRIALSNFFIDKKKANIHLEDSKGMTPLILAVTEVSKHGSEETQAKVFDCIRALHAKGATFNSDDSRLLPQSAMQLACLGGHLKTVQLLIELGQDPHEDIMGKTPLEWAESSNVESALEVANYLAQFPTQKLGAS